MATDPARDDAPGVSGRSGAAGTDAEADLAGIAAAGMVHDLRNALTVILGGLEQLRRQPLDARGREQLDRVEWGARLAGRLARALLASGHGEDAGADAEVVDLNEAVCTFAMAVGQGAGDARFAAELAPGTLPVRLDRSELERALLNLVRNAQDATAGGGRVAIRTAGHRVDGLGGRPTVEVIVSDTGTGMAPKAARHATEAFYTTKGPGHGTGLGLWTVRRFAENAGGKVEIETAPGQGTTVRIVLPRAETG